MAYSYESGGLYYGTNKNFTIDSINFTSSSPTYTTVTNNSGHSIEVHYISMATTTTVSTGTLTIANGASATYPQTSQGMSIGYVTW